MSGTARTALVGASVTAAVVGLGVAQRTADALHDQRWLDLDREQTLAALWSAGLLLAAAATWARGLHQRRLPLSSAVVVAVLALMGLDEWFEVHEDLGAVFYTEWQLVYAPVVLAAGAACLPVLRRWGWGVPTVLLLAGGTCWAVSQVAEALEWWGDTDGPRSTAHYALLLVLEEGLEMAGSLLLLLAAARAGEPLRRAAASAGSPAYAPCS